MHQRNRISVSLPASLEARYRNLAECHGLPLSRLVELALVHAELILVPLLDELHCRTAS
jgi:hypothetical protein